MIRALLALLVALHAAPTAAQTVVTGISTENIALTADFTGSDVLVFGAIRRDAPIPVGEDPIDIVITLQGPPLTVLVRRKERRFGIWVNAEEVRIRHTPSYYAVASTRPIADILGETERLRWQIGLDQAVRRVAAHPTLTDVTDFTEAMVRLRLDSGLFVDAEGAVRLDEQTLFQARFHLPTNLVEGAYAAEYFLVRDGEIISTGMTSITVQKAGIERWLYNLSQNRPLAYGLLSVAVALAAGWLAAAAFRLARR